jgi:hypothetical protein
MAVFRINVYDSEDNSYYSIVNSAIAGEDLIAGDLCYLNTDGKYWKANSSSIDTSGTELRIAKEALVADEEGLFYVQGTIESSGLTVGARYYVSTTDGEITTTEPDDSDIITRYIGTASATDTLEFNPMDVYGNPFDQDLNITDDVTFNSLDLDNSVDASQLTQLTGTVDTYANDEGLYGISGTSFTTELEAGDLVQVGGEVRKILEVTLDDHATVTENFSSEVLSVDFYKVSPEDIINVTFDDVDILTLSQNGELILSGDIYVSDTLGVGTTSPSDKLEVYGGNLIVNDGANKSRLRPSDLYMQQAGVIKAWLRADGNSYLNGGNLGIGTTNPSEKLDVRGNVYIEANFPSITLKNTAGFTQDYSITNQGNLIVEKNGVDGGGSFIIKDENDKTPLSVSMDLVVPVVVVSGNLIVKDRDGTTTNLYVQESTGNVGIGTTSPSSKLHIEESIPNGSLFKVTTSASGSLQPVLDARIESNGDTYYDLTNYKSATKKIQIISANTASITQIDGTGGFDIKGHLKTSLQTVNGGGVLQLHRYGALSLNDDASYAHIPESALYINTLSNTSTDYLMLLANEGSDKLAVDLNGNVGIGTTSPSSILNIVNSNPKIVLEDSDNTGTFGYIRQQAGNLQFLSNNNTANGVIQFRLSDGTTTTDAMRITSSGNVGIGTATPEAKLDVESEILISGTDPILRMKRGDGFNSDILKVESSTDNLIIGDTSLDEIIFEADNGEAIRIISNLNVGIGTTTPSEKLEVSGARSKFNGILVGENGSNIQFPGDGNLTVGNNDWIILSEGGQEVMRVGSNAKNVGIGTTSPSAKLDIKSSSNNSTPFQVTNSSDTDAIFSILEDGGGDGRARIFNAAGTLNVNLDSSGNSYLNGGNVGIGNSSPTKELEIGTNAVAETEFRMNSDTSGKYFNIQSAGNFTSLKTAGSQNFILDSSGSAGYITITTNASERMRVNYNGNVGIGTTNPSAKLHISDSSAASTANLIYLENTGSGGDEGVSIKLNPVFSAESMIASNREGGYGDRTNLSFHTATSNTTTERMRIDSSGKVGIGTSSPTAKLQIVGDTGGIGSMIISDKDTGEAGALSLNLIKTGTSSFLFDGQTTSTMYLGAGTNTQMLAFSASDDSITSTSDVIINGSTSLGTTYNGYRLNVGVDDSSDYSIFATGRIFGSTDIFAAGEIQGESGLFDDLTIISTGSGSDIVFDNASNASVLNEIVPNSPGAAVLNIGGNGGSDSYNIIATYTETGVNFYSVGKSDHTTISSTTSIKSTGINTDQNITANGAIIADEYIVSKQNNIADPNGDDSYRATTNYTIIAGENLVIADPTSSNITIEIDSDSDHASVVRITSVSDTYDVAVVAGSGVTLLNSQSGVNIYSGDRTMITLVKVSTDTWIISGGQ